jgi:hypothetical protein
MRALATSRVLVPTLLVGFVIGGIVWFLGAPLWWGVASGLVAAAAIALWRAMPRLEEPVWSRRLPEAVPGSRDDVLVLGWAIADLRGHVQPRALERVRAVARERLAQRGLDLDAASDRGEIEALLGKRAYAALHSSISNMPGQTALLACLDALDRLSA